MCIPERRSIPAVQRVIRGAFSNDDRVLRQEESTRSSNSKEYSIKSLIALSGGTHVPQIFKNGEKIGGFDQLKEILK